MVLKFGGTSVANPDRIRNAAARAAALHKEGCQVVIVVSAQGQTTDRMIEDARGVDPAACGREMDAYLAAGEQMSAGLMAMALKKMGFDAVSLTGWQAGILTEATYGNARVLGLQNDRILRELEAGKIVVVTGFQGVDENHNITTLGRGGSDTTAVALAAFLKADGCRIYTDVDGVYSADPRKDPHAVRYDRIGYGEMLALAKGGAQVLPDRCVELAQEFGVPIHVLSSFRPGPGTMVTD
jgi:aspartate kinase